MTLDKKKISHRMHLKLVIVYDNWIIRGSMKEKVHMKVCVVWLNDLHLQEKALDVYIVGLLS